MTSQGRVAREQRFAARHSQKVAIPDGDVTGDRAARARLTIIILMLTLCIAALFSLTAGASDASVLSVLRALTSSGAAEGADAFRRDHLIIMEIRLPRIVMGILIGAGLAVSGAVMQGLFRNPLADPGLVGVSAGAGLGAVSMIVLGGSVLAPVIAILGVYALPLAAFLGGLASTLLLYRVATRRGRTSVATMLLAGIALGALAGAATGGLIYLADDRQLRDLTFWGSVRSRVPPGPRLALRDRSLPSFWLFRRCLRVASMRWRWGSCRRSSRHSGAAHQEHSDCDRGCRYWCDGRRCRWDWFCRYCGAAYAAPQHRSGPSLSPAGISLAWCDASASGGCRQPHDCGPGRIADRHYHRAFGAPFFLWILLRQRGLLDL